MKEKSVRVYADTSVFGGVFDEELAEASRTFFEEVRSGRFLLITSALVQAEIAPAPSEVKELFNELLEGAELVDVSDEALDLRDAYLEARVVASQWASDALHVALATVAACDLIVSWNFQHIAHFEKIPMYNAVNVLQRYPAIAIYSPREVLRYEDEDV